MSLTSEFWAKEFIDLELYKSGTKDSSSANKYGICSCQECQNLLAIRDRIVAAKKPATYSSVFNSSMAVVEKEKLSLVVSEPGFFDFEGLDSKTETKFKRVYFPNAGKYSVVSIFKQARSASDSIMLIDSDLNAALEESFGIDSYYSSAFNILPIGELSGEHWEGIKSKLKLSIEGKQKDIDTDSIDFSNVFMIEDRFIPIFYLKGTFTIITGDDGSHKKMKRVPGLPSDDSALSMNYFRKVASKLPKYYCFGDDKQAIPMVYDTQEHAVLTGLNISNAIYHLINDNRDSFSELIQNTFCHAISPVDFMKEIRKDFAINGASEFEIVEFWPKYVVARWSEWETHDKLNHSVSYPGYLAGVNFKGNRLVGRNSQAGGNIHIRFNPEEGRPWLMKSPWCQRMNSWSKHKHGVIDQKYDIWALADWLSGPFAEKCKLKSDAAPLLFSGNKRIDRRAEALKKLKLKLK